MAPSNQHIQFPVYPVDIASGLPIKNLENRAVLGDPFAQFSMGQLYQNGTGVSKNVEEAIKFYDLAANQQELRATYNLALLYLLGGDGLKPDVSKGISYLRDAAFKGNDYAQYALAMLLQNGYRDQDGNVVLEPDLEQALSMYYLSAANGYGLAQYRLAEMLIHDRNNDMSFISRLKRNKLIKELLVNAYQNQVQEAEVPLAFYNAMSTDKNKQMEAFTVAKKEAQQGNAYAALLLGLLYERGIQVQGSLSDALYWYQQAPLNTVTAFILGTAYCEGRGISKDIEKGKALLKQAADAGFPYAYFNLAILKHEEHEPFIPDLQKALELGSGRAGLLLADYSLSLGNDQEQMEQARAIYQRLANKGNRDAQLKLAYMYEHGLGGLMDLLNAEKWYQAAAVQHQAVAQYFLGRLYQLGLVHDEPNYELAKKWYSLSQKTFSPAAVALGFLYETFEDNYPLAQASYEQAIQLDNMIGSFNLGLVYEYGKGVSVDYNKARELYTKAALAGHKQAMVQLAGLYFNGLGVSRDPQEALEWYKKAASLNERDALYQLGLLAETGVTMPLNLNEAMQFYKRAATLGNEKAMLALARIYQYGLAGNANPVEAQKLYQQLANQGNAYAQYKLAMIYYYQNDAKSLQQCKNLLKVAEQNGNYQAEKTLRWLDAQQQVRLSFIEPALLNSTNEAQEQPVELRYFDALNEWNRGDERGSRIILNKIVTQFPDYIPAKRAHEQLDEKNYKMI